jgi:hypothetical protein
MALYRLKALYEALVFFSRISMPPLLQRHPVFFFVSFSTPPDNGLMEREIDSRFLPSILTVYAAFDSPAYMLHELMNRSPYDMTWQLPTGTSAKEIADFRLELAEKILPTLTIVCDKMKKI